MISQGSSSTSPPSTSHTEPLFLSLLLNRSIIIKAIFCEVVFGLCKMCFFLLHILFNIFRTANLSIFVLLFVTSKMLLASKVWYFLGMQTLCAYFLAAWLGGSLGWVHSAQVLCCVWCDAETPSEFRGVACFHLQHHCNSPYRHLDCKLDCTGLGPLGFQNLELVSRPSTRCRMFCWVLSVTGMLSALPTIEVSQMIPAGRIWMRPLSEAQGT